MIRSVGTYTCGTLNHNMYANTVRSAVGFVLSLPYSNVVFVFVYRGLCELNVPRKYKTFAKHLYNVGPMAKTLCRRCINVIQMFCFVSVTVRKLVETLVKRVKVSFTEWILYKICHVVRQGC